MDKSHETWTDGAFPRDTLVYFLGTLAELILREALADPSVQTRYRTWLARGPESLVCPLVTTGIADRGELTLLARAGEHEFCIQCTHSEFIAIAPLGFDVDTGLLEGVCIAHFEGSVLDAVDFMRELARELGKKRTPRSRRQAN